MHHAPTSTGGVCVWCGVCVCGCGWVWGRVRGRVCGRWVVGGGESGRWMVEVVCVVEVVMISNSVLGV